MYMLTLSHPKKGTYLGCALSILVFGLVFSYFIYLGNQYVSNQIDPKFRQQSFISEEHTSIDLHEDLVGFRFEYQANKNLDQFQSMQNKTYLVYYALSSYSNQGNINLTKLDIIQCRNSRLIGYICLDYSNLSNSTLFLSAKDNTLNSLLLLVYGCYDLDEIKTEIPENCASQEEINNLINGNSAGLRLKLYTSDYNYSFYPINLLVSCMLQSSVYYYLPTFNIAISVLFSLLVELLDYNYTFHIEDFLSKKFNKKSLIVEALECMSIFLLTQSSKSLFLIGAALSILTQSTQLILLYYSNILLSKIIKKAMTQISILNIFLLFYSIFYTQNLDQSPNILLIFILIVLSLKLGNICFEFFDYYSITSISSDIQNQQILRKDYTNLDKLEYFLRLINEESYVFYQDYVKTYKSQIIENAITNHMINCKIRESCFCKILEEDQSKEDKITYIMNEQNRECLKNLSLSILKAHIEEIPTTLNDFQILYYKFIQGVLENQTLSLATLLKIQQNSFEKFNLFEMQFINRMVDRVRYQIEQSNNQKLENSNYQINSKKQQRIQLIQQVLFDEKLSQAFHQLLNCLYQKNNLLDTLNQDTINLDKLEELSNKLLSDRFEVKKALKQLIIENGSQTQLQKMCKLYDLVLDIDNYFERKISSQNQFNCLASIPLSSKESCYVYISFTSKLGVVTKISNNFEKIVPVYSNKEVIGKNINFMQPDVIAPVHNKILTKFIQKKIVSQKIDDYPLLIGKDKRGFCIPYHIKIQVAMIGLEDFGCAGWIKQIKDSTHYIMTSADQGFKNYIMGQSFFDLILSFTFKQSELSTVKFGHLIPLLQTLFDSNMSGKSFQTILIRPQYKEQIAYQIKVKNNDSLFQELIDLDLYLIQAQFIYLNTTYATFNYLLITQCDYIENLSSKRDALKEFRKDLKIYNQSEEYNEVDFEQLFPSFYNNAIQQIEEESKLLLKQDTQNSDSIDQQQEETQKPNPSLLRPSHFQDKHNVKYASKLQKIIKQNRFKINQMYQNLKVDQKTSLQEKNIQSRNSYSQGHHQNDKIDEIQENFDTNFTLISGRSSCQKSSYNSLMVGRVERYFDDAKKDDQIQMQNSFQFTQNIPTYGIEQMLFEDQKQKKDANKLSKQYSTKYIDKAQQQFLAQYQKNKHIAKTSNLNQSKQGRDQDTNVSADISFILNERQKQTTAQGSVNLSNQKSTSANRLSLARKIQSNDKKHFLFYSGYILDSLLIILLIVSISISFASNYRFLEGYKSKQNLFSDLNTMKKLIYNILEEIHLVDGVQKKYFTLQTSADSQSFLYILNTAKDSNIYQYKNISQSIFKNYISEQRVQDLYQAELDYHILSYVQDKFISQEISNCSLFISLLRTQQLITMSINNTITEDFIFLNELRYNQNQIQIYISQILHGLNQDLIQNYKTQKKNIYLFIIIYGVFIIFYSILLLLFYNNSVSLKYSLLSIFATIDIKKLDEMINKTTQIIKYLMDYKKKYKILDQITHKNEGQQNLANQQDNKKNFKKKNISLTTYKKKLTVSKIFLVIFCLSTILIKPCIEYYFISVQLDFMKISGSLQNSSEKLITAFSDFSQAKFIYTYYIIGGSNELTYNYTNQDQQQYLLQSYANMQVTLSDFMDTFQTFQNSNIIQLEQKNISYIIQQDICNPLQQYSSSLKLFNSTDIQSCLNIYQKTKNSGFYISSQMFDTIQYGIIQYFSSDFTSAQKSAYLNTFFKQNSVSEQFYELKILDQISQILSYLLKSQQQNFFNSIKIIIFNKFVNDYQKSKQYLTLVDYEILQENPYFVSHIKKIN
ncbi:hypothetical protein ABPG72_009745 [Tetrahymena utriculariae]